MVRQVRSRGPYLQAPGLAHCLAVLHGLARQAAAAPGCLRRPSSCPQSPLFRRGTKIESSPCSRQADQGSDKTAGGYAPSAQPGMQAHPGNLAGQLPPRHSSHAGPVLTCPPMPPLPRQLPAWRRQPRCRRAPAPRLSAACDTWQRTRQPRGLLRRPQTQTLPARGRHMQAAPLLHAATRHRLPAARRCRQRIPLRRCGTQTAIWCCMAGMSHRGGMVREGVRGGWGAGAATRRDQRRRREAAGGVPPTHSVAASGGS